MPEQDYYGLSESQLKASYFWVKNKLLFKKILQGILIVFDVIFCVYVIAGLVIYFLIGWSRHQENMKQLAGNYTDFVAWHAYIEPDPLIFSDVILLSHTPGKYDFAVEVENPNPDWMVREIEFQFTAGEVRSEKQVFYIYPEETKYLFDLQVASDIRPTSVEFQVTNLAWLRAEQHKQFASTRYAFDIKNLDFVTSRELEISKDTPVHRVMFDVTNAGLYDYWNVGFVVALTRGERLTVLNYVGLSDLLASETREVDLAMIGSYASGATVDIFPDLNVYDPTVYRPLNVRLIEEEQEQEEIVIFSKQL